MCPTLVSNPSSLHLHLPFPVHDKYGLLQPYVRGNDGHTRCAYTPVPHLREERGREERGREERGGEG